MIISSVYITIYYYQSQSSKLLIKAIVLQKSHPQLFLPLPSPHPTFYQHLPSSVLITEWSWLIQIHFLLNTITTIIFTWKPNPANRTSTKAQPLIQTAKPLPLLTAMPLPLQTATEATLLNNGKTSPINKSKISSKSSQAISSSPADLSSAMRTNPTW